LEVEQVLVYADSLTWGIIPGTRRRLPFDARWPGVMELALRANGRQVRVIEDCLNGRRTVYEDPYKPGRNGLTGVEQRVEVNSPLALVILMLGTNDFQSMHPHTPWHAAEGVAAIVRAIRRAPIEPGMPVPEVLVVVPPPIVEPRGPIAAKFAGAAVKCAGLGAEYRRMASEVGCHLFDAAEVTGASVVDGIHLDPDQHVALGRRLAVVVEQFLSSKPTEPRAAPGPAT
jgi:lysophospholipase L1-like esterase